MAQVFVLGRVTADLKLKQSPTDNSYVCFDLAEHIGYGEKRRNQYYQVWAWGADALRLVRLGVKKDSMIWLTGSLELVDCTEKSGEVKTMRLKVYLDNWGHIPSGPLNQCSAEAANEPKATETDLVPPIAELDGEREPLPE